MTRRSLLSILCCLLLAGGAYAAQSPAAVTLFVPERGSVSHPQKTTLRVMIEEKLSGPISACVEYGNTVSPADGGRVLVKLSIVRDGRTVARRQFSGNVRNRHVVRCVDLRTSLREGDVAVFRLRFKNFPRLTRRDAYVAFAGLIPG